MKFGFGEVERTDKGNSIATARNGFQGLVAEIEPHVLEDLYKITFEPFLALDEAEANYELRTYLDGEFYDSEPNTRCRDIAERIRIWAQKYNLEAYWLLARAYNTLYNWRLFSSTREPLQWAFSGNAWFRLDFKEREKLPVPPFGLSEWDADYEMQEFFVIRAEQQIETQIEQNSWSHSLSSKTKRAIKDDVNAQIMNYCENVLQVYLSQVNISGEPMWKRTEVDRNIMRNMRWAVKYQVCEQSSEEIAGEYDVSHTTVLRAVDSVLELIGLPKRPDAKRGRPPVGKESANSWRRSINRAKIIQ
jgi:hypothetical protein